jgi:hypothetical protein
MFESTKGLLQASFQLRTTIVRGDYNMYQFKAFKVTQYKYVHETCRVLVSIVSFSPWLAIGMNSLRNLRTDRFRLKWDSCTNKLV